MFIAIANAIGLGRSGSYITKLINTFKRRVANDGGIFEAEACLLTTLTNLNNIE